MNHHIIIKFFVFLTKNYITQTEDTPALMADLDTLFTSLNILCFLSIPGFPHQGYDVYVHYDITRIIQNPFVIRIRVCYLMTFAAGPSFRFGALLHLHSCKGIWLP